MFSSQFAKRNATAAFQSISSFAEEQTQRCGEFSFIKIAFKILQTIRGLIQITNDILIQKSLDLQCDWLVLAYKRTPTWKGNVCDRETSFYYQIHILRFNIKKTDFERHFYLPQKWNLMSYFFLLADLSYPIIFLCVWRICKR